MLSYDYELLKNVMKLPMMYESEEYDKTKYKSLEQLLRYGSIASLCVSPLAKAHPMMHFNAKLSWVGAN